MLKSFAQLAFAFVLCSGTAQAQVGANTNAELYDMLLTEITKWIGTKQKLSGEQEGLVQVLTTPQEADWGDSSYGRWSAGRLCDAVPSDGAAYNPTGRSVFRQFEMYVRSIKLPEDPDAAKQKQIDEARKKADASLKAWIAALEKSRIDWDTFNKTEVAAKRPQLTYNNWLLTTKRGLELGSLENKHYIDAQTYWSKLGKLAGNYDLVAAVLQNIIDKSSRPELPTEGGDLERVPVCFITPSVSKWASAAQAAFAAKPEYSTWAFDKNYKFKGSSTSAGGASLGFGGFFKFDAGGNKNTESVNTKDDNFRLELKFAQAGIFTFRRGEWYRPDLMKLFMKRDQFYAGPNAILADPPTQLFGNGGSFRMASSQVVVLYKPQLKIRLSKADYNKIKESWKVSTSFSVGPFKLNGGERSGGRENEAWNDASNEVTFSVPSENPQVIAVINNLLP